MKALLVLMLAIFWQVAPAAAPAPQHMRYERTVDVPRGATGQACAVLDATVFAHAANASLNDLRLYAKPSGGHEIEAPFTLTESEAAFAEDEQAAVNDLGERNSDIVFDLAMPQRPYTAVVLDLDAKNFIATAHVSGIGSHGAGPTDLGSFALFDLSAQHLGRSTTLPLQESTFPVLHIALHMAPAPGGPVQIFRPTIIQGATIPPSREAQTLYTTVAQTSSIVTRGRESDATIDVPAHVPVERISFLLRPGFTHNFLRTVEITARPDAALDKSQEEAESEAVTGEIEQVRMSGGSEAAGNAETPRIAEAPYIDSRKLSIDDAIGANLRSAATVVVAIENGDDAALPVSAIRLEMRQRKICFDAASATAYTLMYGDPALHAPVYDYARLFIASARPVAATLGPERRNPAFVARVDDRPYTERHPELLWIALLAAIAALGSVALRGARRQSGR